MRRFWIALMAITLTVGVASAAERAEMSARRQRAARLYSDGVLLLHSRGIVSFDANGYHEDPGFYYLTGIEDARPSILAIDGKSGESWLFVGEPVTVFAPIDVGVKPGREAAERLGIEHVEDWNNLERFLERQAAVGGRIFYEQGPRALPANLSATKDVFAPAWIQVIGKKWPSLDLEAVERARFLGLMAVQSAPEQEMLGKAAKATVKALLAGMKAVKAEVSQRRVEAVIEAECWSAGAQGVAFWPWVMAGPKSVFPKPLESLVRYDHLNGQMKAGDLVRLDVGCEWDHYQGDLGRTVPVSGKYTVEQREIWTIFVAAYQAGVKRLAAGVTVDQVFDAWKSELLLHRGTARSEAAREAIELWSEQKNVPYWQIHTMNLDAGFVEGPLRSGMTIAFEPIAAFGGQGYYLEDMFLITEKGAEILTPGIPYSASEIEALMAR